MSTNTLAQKPTGAVSTEANRPMTVRGLLSSPGYKKRFEDTLGSRAPQFIASIAATASAPHLAKADPNSVIAAAFIAATLDLPISPSLGFAHIVPYKQGDGPTIAQFQMGYKGYIQLALRTGQYKSLNDFVVYEGQLKSHNEMTGELVFNPDGKTSDVIIGYGFFFELLNGFRKVAYWSKSKVEAHAKRYSKSYSKPGSPWKEQFDAMALKTIISATLRKYGILSIEMQRAIEHDGAAQIDVEATPVFPDQQNLIHAGGSTSDASASEGALAGATSTKASTDTDSTDELGAPPKA